MPGVALAILGNAVCPARTPALVSGSRGLPTGIHPRIATSRVMQTTFLIVFAFLVLRFREPDFPGKTRLRERLVLAIWDFDYSRISLRSKPSARMEQQRAWS